MMGDMDNWTPSCDRFEVVTGPYSLEEHAYLIRHGFLQMTQTGEYSEVATITNADNKSNNIVSRRKSSNYDDDGDEIMVKRKLFIEKYPPIIEDDSPIKNDEASPSQMDMDHLDLNPIFPTFSFPSASHGNKAKSPTNSFPLTSTPVTSPPSTAISDDEEEEEDIMGGQWLNHVQKVITPTSPVCRPALAKRRRTIFATFSPTNNNKQLLLEDENKEEKQNHLMVTSSSSFDSLTCPNNNNRMMPMKFNSFSSFSSTTTTTQKFSMNTGLARPVSTCPKSRTMTTSSALTLPKLKELP